MKTTTKKPQIKVTAKITKAIDKHGYTEIEEYLNGKRDLKGLIQFAEDMSMSEVESSREQLVCNNLAQALQQVHDQLAKTKQATEQELQDLQSAIDGLPAEW